MKTASLPVHARDFPEMPAPRTLPADPSIVSAGEKMGKFSSGFYFVLMIAASVVIPAIVVGRDVIGIRKLYSITPAEGVWLTCAQDFMHGVFYRPLLGPFGYGGTRYFPLYFVLTGIFSKIAGSLENSALLLCTVSLFLLACAVYVLLRRLNVSVALSFAAVAAVLAAATTQEALVGAKGDAMAAMLNLWGVALCIGPKVKRPALYAAAVLFTLAFATKLTSVFGAGAVFLVWIFYHRYKEAWEIALTTCAGYALVLSAMYFGSHGRALEVFRACASGGTSLSYVLQAP